MEGSRFLLSISNSDGMKKFLWKIVFVVACSAIFVMSVYSIMHGRAESTRPTNPKCIYVWGDSQMAQGLDVRLLGKKLGIPVLTAAGHGTGVYDFLICVENIPDSSICIVSFPEAAFLRNPSLDFHRYGFELGCLETLFRSGCPLEECIRIAGLNKRKIDYRLFTNIEHEWTPYQDSLVGTEYFDDFRRMFTEKKAYFTWKTNSYLTGIQHLIEKHVRVILIRYPFAKQVEDIAANSINRHLSDSLKGMMIDKYRMRCDTIALQSDSLLMFDLSHLNEVGERLLTNAFGEAMKADTVNNRFFVVTVE